MSKVRIQTGQTEPVVVLAVDDDGDPITGLADLKLRVRRTSNGHYLDWVDNTFKAAPGQLYMTLVEVNAARSPGEYELNTAPHLKGLNTAAFVNAYAEDSYVATVIQDALVQTASNMPQIGEIAVGGWIDYIDASIADGASYEDVRQALRDYGLDHLVSINPGIVPPAANTYIRQILDKVDSIQVDIEATYTIKQNWSYNPGTDELVGQVWVETGNLVMADPGGVLVTWYNELGTTMFSVSSATPDAQGIFRIVKQHPGVVRNKSYYSIAQLDLDGVGTITGAKGSFTIG